MDGGSSFHKAAPSSNALRKITEQTNQTGTIDFTETAFSNWWATTDGWSNVDVDDVTFQILRHHTTHDARANSKAVVSTKNVNWRRHFRGVLALWPECQFTLNTSAKRCWACHAANPQSRSHCAMAH